MPTQLLDMKLSLDGLEKERDFYFGKLRDIELICQDGGNGSNPVLNKIMEILYATEVQWRHRQSKFCFHYRDEQRQPPKRQII